MTIKEARNQLVAGGVELKKKGLVARTWGNLSIRPSEESFVISPSGLHYENIEPDQVPVVSLADLTWTGPIKPSSEKALHARIYRQHPEVRAVVHTHQAAASSLAASRHSPNSTLPCAAYHLPTTPMLAKAAARALLGQRGQDELRLLLANHGAVVAAPSLDRAIGLALDLEDECDAYVREYHHSHPDETYGHVLALQNETPEPRRVVNRDGGDADVSFADVYNHVFDRREDVKVIVHSHQPYLQVFSGLKTSLRPMLDDMAQLIGVRVGHVAAGRLGHSKEPAARHAVFLNGDGALCLGKNLEDALAVELVLEKAARCAIESHVLSRGYFIPLLERHFMRWIYQSSYSKSAVMEAG